jgi:ATP/maltotriose-dependent transcriptional regulator MalT
VDYDADRAPDPAAWSAAPEPERLAAAEAHHRALVAPHPETRQPRVHAAIHVVVEDQLASGAPPEARRAMDRLVRGGLSRHEAVHAIASVVASAAQGALAGARFDAGAYARALDALTAEGWRAGGESR